MSLPLKILITSTNLTKTMLFAPNMSVAEACKSIREKIGEEGGADHGLFQPAQEAKRSARWLRNDRTLAYYELQPNDTLEYKKKHRAIKVKLPDETQKTFLVDDTLSISGIVSVIGEKMSLTNSEEFSLKVEGKEKWLTATQTLREQGVPDDAILLLKKKYHVGPVSIEDPITLHLVYIESRDAILNGNHPCREDEAVMFAALQMQIQHNNYDPNKPRPIDIKLVLPPSFHKGNKKKLEEKINKEYKKLVGMNESNAKYRYVQLCRSLKTYGITFFEVKVKGKGQSRPKKLFLGVTRDGVLFMDFETKEIVKEYQLTQLKRWAAAPTTFTLDFGDYAEEYAIIITDEGEAISSLIAGYIDILLKKKNDAAMVSEEGSGNLAAEEPIAPIRAQALTSTTMSSIGGVDKFAAQQYSISGGAQQYTKGPSLPGGAKKAVPTSVTTAQTFVTNLMNEMSGKGIPFSRNTALTPSQWRKQVISNSDAVLASNAKMAAALPPNQLDKGLLDQKSAEIAMNLAQLISAARNAASGPDGDDDVDLLAGAKRVADSVKNLLDAAKDLADKPNDPAALERFLQAQKALQAANAFIQSASKGVLSDPSSQKLLIESSKNVAAATQDLLMAARNKADQSNDIKIKGKVESAALDANKAADQLSSEVTSLAPAILNDSIKKQIENSALALEGATTLLQHVAQWDDDEDPNLALAAKGVSDAIAQLLATTQIAEPADKGPDLAPAAQEILEETARLMAAQGNADQINASTKIILVASTKLVTAAKQAATLLPDEESQNRLLNSAKGVAEATRRLVQNAGNAASNINSLEAFKALQDSCQRLADATQALAGNAGERAALQNLRSVTKVAAAATSGLISAAKQASGTCNDPVSTENLKNASKIASDAIQKLIKTLTYAWQNPLDKNAQDALVKETHDATPQAYKLVAASKSALPKITDPNNKQLLRQAADEAAEALQKLVSANKQVVVSVGQADVNDALDKFSSEEANLDSALLELDNGGFRTDSKQTSEGALQLLNVATKEVAGAVKKMVMTAKTNPDEFGPAARNLADAIAQANVAAMAVARVIPDRKVQQDVLQAAKGLTREARNALTSARAVASNPSDPNLNKMLSDSARSLADALSTLLTAAKGSAASANACDEAMQAITNAMSKLQPMKGNVKDFPTYAQDLENSIKAVQAAIGSLVNSSKNNPMGIGASAKTVATTVNPLVSSANAAAGTCSDDQTKKDILSGTKEAAKDIKKLLNTVKESALKEDPTLKDAVSRSAIEATGSLDKLLSAVNAATPGQEGLDEALRIVAEAAHRLQTDAPSRAASKDISMQIEDLKRATTRLGEATKQIIAASRTSPDKMGGLSKDAASSVITIVDTAKALANSAGKQSIFSEEAQRVKGNASALVSSCLSKDPNVRKTIVNNAKDTTIAAQQLANVIKTATDEMESDDAQPLIESGKILANLTAQLVNGAKGAAQGTPGAIENLQTVHNRLNQAIDQLLSIEGTSTVTPKGKKLLKIAQETTVATTSLIESSKGVLKHPNDSDAQTDLTNSSRQVGTAIKGLMEAAKSMGEIDLDDVIDLVSQAIMELDSASISATVGLLETSIPSGKTTQVLEEELVEVSRDLANSIKNLVTAQKESPAALQRAARTTAQPIPKVAELSKQLAGSMSDSEKQQQQLNLAKNIGDAILQLLQACKQNDAKAIPAQAKNSSTAIGNLLNSMKGGVLSLRLCDEAARIILEESKKLDLPPVPGSSRGYSEAQRELNTTARELVAGIAKIVSASKTSPQEVGDNAKAVAGIIAKFVESTHTALSAINDPSAQRGLLSTAHAVTGATNKIVMNAKFVASDSKNNAYQQKLSASYKEVTEAIAAYIVAVKAGATGEIKCEAAIDQINRNIADLDASALYAATGQLKPESDDQDMETVGNELIATTKALAQEVQGIVSSVDKSDNDLGDVAADSAQTYDKLSKETKVIASLMSSNLNQQEILMGSKTVGSALAALIGAALKVHTSPKDGGARKSLLEASQRVAATIRELAALGQNASNAASSGIRELELAKKGILQALDDYNTIPPLSGAGAHEVLKAAKGIADGIAGIALGSNSEDSAKLIQSAESTMNSAKDLLVSAKGALKLTNETHGRKLIDAVKSALQSTAVFLEAAKLNRRQQNAETQKQLSEANDEVVRMIGEVVEACKPLPGSEEALKMFQEQDELEQLAEKELMNAADTIAQAAKTLLEAKQRQLEMRKNKDSPLPEEEITEAILDAARAITTATATLVASATVAQKELVAKGQISKQQSVYRRDPAWAKGLISAAQSVAGTVKDLVTAANDAAQGKAEEEALIASAKGVAAATARLVFASRAKADPFSPTQKKLSAAAKSVAEATQQLVDAAKSTTEAAEEQESTPDWESATQTEKRRAEVEAQVKILKLQKELDKERIRLGELRKNEYKDANASAAPQQAPRKQTAPPSAPMKATIVKSPSSGGNPPPPPKERRASSAQPPQYFPLDTLLKRPVPNGIDGSKLEAYLTDEDFVKVFGMDKRAFYALPGFKQSSEKQKRGLFVA